MRPWALVALLACSKGGNSAKSEDKPVAAPGGPMEASRTARMAELGELLAKDAGDCDKLAGDLDKYLADHAADWKALAAWEAKLSPAERKAEDDQTQDKEDDMLTKAEPAMAKCAGDAKVKAVIDKLAAGAF